MEISYTRLKQELGIDPNVMYDINKQLKIRTDYLRKQKHSHSGGRTYYYTKVGQMKVTSYVEDVRKLQEGMQDALFSLRYDKKAKDNLNILIGIGAYCYLKELGYRKSTIAYILKKNRTTFYNTEKVLPIYAEDPICNAVISETIKQLKQRLQWQDQ